MQTKTLTGNGSRPETVLDASGALEEAVKDWIAAAQATDPQEMLRELNKLVIEAFLEGEMDFHQGYLKHDPVGDDSGNSRNGHRTKTVRTEVGEVEIRVPRDRNGTCTSAAVRPYQRRLSGFDDMVVLAGLGLIVGRCVMRWCRRCRLHVGWWRGGRRRFWMSGSR